MQSREVAVSNPHGLHARACAQIVHAASRFACEVFLTAGGQRASARNLLAVMLLAASVGTVVRIEADGRDADGAVREIATLIEGRASAGA